MIKALRGRPNYFGYSLTIAILTQQQKRPSILVHQASSLYHNSFITQSESDLYKADTYNHYEFQCPFYVRLGKGNIHENRESLATICYASVDRQDAGTARHQDPSDARYSSFRSAQHLQGKYK